MLNVSLIHKHTSVTLRVAYAIVGIPATSYMCCVIAKCSLDSWQTSILVRLLCYLTIQDAQLNHDKSDFLLHEGKIVPHSEKKQFSARNVLQSYTNDEGYL